MVELSRTEYRTCAAFLMQDRDTQRVYRLYDFTKAQLMPPDQVYCVAGMVNRSDELHLVIESVRPVADTLAIPLFLFLLTAREGRVSASRSLFVIRAIPRRVRARAAVLVCLALSPKRDF
jgi:hypothetical protein